MTARGVWKQMTEVRTGMVAVVAVAGVGFAGAISVTTFIGLPQRVEAVEQVNARQDSTLAEIPDVERKLDRVLCLVEALAAEQDPVARGCVR